MRISDWSSDVCSSDLAESLGHVAARSLSMNVARPGPYRTKERLPDRGPILLCPEPAHPGEAAPRASSPPKRRAATVSPRSEERLVGKECVRTRGSWWSADTDTTKPHQESNII